MNVWPWTSVVVPAGWLAAEGATLAAVEVGDWDLLACTCDEESKSLG